MNGLIFAIVICGFGIVCAWYVAVAIDQLQKCPICGKRNTKVISWNAYQCQACKRAWYFDCLDKKYELYPEPEN